MTQTALWYVVNVFSGFEKKVVESIREQAAKKGVEDLFLDLLVPTEESIEIKRGAKVNVQKNFFPGYVLIKMVLTDDTWHLVRNTPKVAGFLGGKGRPVPISEGEVARILDQVKEGMDKPKISLSFEVGESVRVCDGPFMSFSGVVEDVELERERLKVSVSIFGRSTPVELEFSQVEKI